MDLEVKDLVGPLASVKGISRKQALEVAQTILKVADGGAGKSSGTDSHDGRLSFTEYMSLLEGNSSMDFDSFVSLVHTTGQLHALNSKDMLEASHAYESVLDQATPGRARFSVDGANAPGLGEDSTLRQINKQVQRQKTGFFRTETRELVCDKCESIVLVPDDKKPGTTILCSQCNNELTVPATTIDLQVALTAAGDTAVAATIVIQKNARRRIVRARSKAERTIQGASQALRQTMTQPVSVVVVNAEADGVQGVAGGLASSTAKAPAASQAGWV